MTNEQAIMKLKYLQFDPTTDEFDEEALEMAIKALTHFNSDSNSIKNELNDDLISRQDAIDVAKQHWYKPDIAKALAELPSPYTQE